MMQNLRRPSTVSNRCCTTPRLTVGTWMECEVTLEQIKARCRQPIEGGAPALWEAALGMAENHYQKRTQQD